MRHDEGVFQGSGDLRLYYQRWRPDDGAPRAVIVMVHGDFAQSGWYMNLPSHETPRGYAVYAPDRRGWGRSPGQRGYVRAWGDYLDDLAAFLQVVREAEPGHPIFLFGHTGSGPIVLEYATRRPQEVRGVCCISPVLTATALPPGIRLLASALSVIAPRLTLNVTRQADKRWDRITHDAEFNTFAREDPLRNTNVTPRWLIESSAAMRRVSAQAASFPVPLLMLLGGGDQISPLQSSRDFYQAVTLPDKEFHEYPGAYTNLLSDTTSDQVLHDIGAWLDRHTS